MFFYFSSKPLNAQQLGDTLCQITDQTLFCCLWLLIFAVSEFSLVKNYFGYIMKCFKSMLPCTAVIFTVFQGNDTTIKKKKKKTLFQ